MTQNRQIKSKAKHISKAISKTKLIQKQITKSLTDNVQTNIKLNIKTNSEEFPAETTKQINTIDPKQADQVKNKTYIKSNLKNQIDPKTNIRQGYG